MKKIIAKNKYLILTFVLALALAIAAITGVSVSLSRNRVAHANNSYFVPTVFTTTFDKRAEEYTITGLDVKSDEWKSMSESDRANIKIVIPAVYDDGTNGSHPVTTIGVNAFNCFSMTKYNGYDFTSLDLTGATYLRTIDSAAFSSCKSLDCELVIPRGVQTINMMAFEGCEKLRGDLVIPNTVETIGSSAFLGCKSLENSLIFEENSVLTTIGGGAFSDCINLKNTLEIPNSVTKIGGSAFFQCTGFTSLTFEANSSLLTIGDNAFDGCSGFNNTLDIPSSVTEIGKYAFRKCTGFTSLNFETNSSLLTIGDNAFDGCSGFNNNLEIPSSVTEIGQYAFRDCTGFTSLTFGADSSLTKINSYAFSNLSFKNALEIPNRVTEIGHGAFSRCIGFTGLTFAANSSLTTISDYAFEGCKGFKGSLKLPNSVTTIQDYAFKNCSGFDKELVLPENPEFTEILSSVFSGCENFTGKVVIPNSVVKIEFSAFSSLRKVSQFEISNISLTEAVSVSAFNVKVIVKDKETYDRATATDGMLAAIKSYVTYETPVKFYLNKETAAYAEQNKLYNYSFNYEKDSNGLWKANSTDYALPIPEAVPTNHIITGIYDKAIGGSKISTTSRVTKDAYYCLTKGKFSTEFSNNEYIITGFTTEYLNSLTKVEKQNISIVIPDQYDDGTNGTHIVSEIGANAFGKNKSMYNDCTFTSIDLSHANHLRIIGQSSFAHQDKITGPLEIPNGVGVIDASAFYGCKGFTGLNFAASSSLVTINDYAFYNCTGFTNSLVIPDKVTVIGENAFEGCTGFTGLNFETNSSLLTIGDNAFDGCLGFNNTLDIPSSVTEIGKFAFRKCTGFAGLTFASNSSLTAINACAFNGCTGFSNSLEIPNSVTIIDWSAFDDCSGFVSLTFASDSSLTTINDYAFKGCTGFRNALEIPYGVMFIGSSAFNGCSGFTGLTFAADSSLVTIDSYAFANCSGLKNALKIPAGVTEIKTGAFLNCSEFISLTFIETSSLRTIDSHAFAYCSGFKNVLEIPAGVIEIGESAFDSCFGFVGLTFATNSSLSEIGDDAFECCSGFMNVLEVPNSVRAIGESAFYGCTGLTGLTFAENSSLTTIGSSAFAYCFELQDCLKIPGSVTQIDVGAFAGCDNIKQIEIPDLGLTIAVLPETFPNIPIILKNKAEYENAIAESGVLADYQSQATYLMKVSFYLNDSKDAYQEQNKLYNQALGYTLNPTTGIWVLNNSYTLPTANVPPKYKNVGVFNSLAHGATKVTASTLVNQSAYYQITQPDYQQISATLKENSLVSYGDSLESIYEKLIVVGYFSDDTNETIENYTVTFANDETRKTFLTGVNSLIVTYAYKDGSTKIFKIDIDAEQIKLEKPIVTGTYIYTGEEQQVALNGFDGSKMTVVQGNNETDAGSYTVVVHLIDNVNYTWSDGSTDDLNISWSIGRKGVDKPTISGEYTYNGQAQTANVVTNDFYTVTDNIRTNANEKGYTVTVTLKKNYEWKDDGSTDSLKLTWIIRKATVSVNASYDTDAKVFVNGTLPTIFSDKSELGTIAWDQYSLETAGPGIMFDWTWTPLDTDNYMSVSGTGTFDIIAVELASIIADFMQGETKIYTSGTLEELKNLLVVSGVNNDGSDYNDGAAITDYTLEGNLKTAGTVTITVKYNGKETTFTVRVTQVALESISAQFTQGTISVFTSTSIDDLKTLLGDALIVNMIYNDGSSEMTTSFTLTSDLSAAGNVGITVNVSGLSTGITVQVTAVSLESIDATYTQGNKTIYASGSLADLKADLHVTGKNNDGSIYNGTIDYILSGTLSAGISIVTVTVKETTIKDTFEVMVTAVTLESITAVFAPGENKVYQVTTLDSLRQWLTVSGRNNDGSDHTNPIEYTLSGSLSTAGRTVVTVKVKDNTEITAEFEVLVTASVLESLAVTTDPDKTAYKAFENFDPTGMIVTARFNWGLKTVNTYEIIGGLSMAAGTVTVLISFTDGGVTKTALVNISVKKIQFEIPEVTGNYVYNKNELEVTIDGLTDKMEISGSTSGTNAGDYTLTVKIKDPNNYEWINGQTSVTLVWKIEKADIDMTGVTFTDKTVIEDGKIQTLTVNGSLPDGVKVSYSGGNQTAPGIYTVTANFTLTDTENYNELPSLTAKLTINQAHLTVESWDDQKKETVIVESEHGLAPGTVLEANDATETNHNINITDKSSEVKQVYDVRLLQNGAIIDPESAVTVRLLVAENLRRDKTLRVFSVAEDGTPIDLNAVRDGDYLVFLTSSLDTFAIVGEVVHVSAGAIAATVIFWILALLVASYICYYYRKKKSQTKADGSHPSAKKTYSLSPLFLTAVIPGGLLAGLIIGIVVFLLTVGVIIYLHLQDGFLKAFLNRRKKEENPDEEMVILNTGIKAEPAVKWHPESEPEHEADKGETGPEEEISLKSSFRFAQSVYHRSFIAKLIQGSEINKRYYCLLRNELLSYKKVHSSISFAGDTFNFGRKRLAVINIAGQTLKLYLALDPHQIESKYTVKDLSTKKKYVRTPSCIRIKNDIRLRKAIYLISRLMQETGAKYQADYRRTDYVRMYPFEETEALIERGLIKKAGSNSKAENVSTEVVKVDSQNAKVMKEKA